MNNIYKIREYLPQDRKEVEEISWQIQEWEKKFYPRRALSKEVIRKQVNNILRSVKSGKGVVYVAVDDNKCVGYISAHVHEDYLNTETVLYINNFGVREDERGKGIGNLLLKKIELVAKTKYKLHRMMIGVICGNDCAESLYKKNGYKPYELELVKEIPKIDR